MNGKQVLPLIKKGKRCVHLHYSGRRCAAYQRDGKTTHCKLHALVMDDGDPKCHECAAMLKAFQMEDRRRGIL